MLLVVDAGNTQTHLGTFRDGELVQHWRFATVRESTADELGAVLRNLLALRGMHLEMLDGVIVSSTVPALRPEWAAMGERYLDGDVKVVGPGLKTGMPIRYDNPREIGPDRLVNAVAGYEQLGGPCTIVDFGTAVTYDVVSADGEYLGGIIFPGVEISMEALTERAAALPKIDLGAPARADRQDDDRRDPRRRRLRVRGHGRRHPRAPARRARRGDAGDRDRRPGERDRAVLRVDRRRRRPAHAHRPAADLGTQPVLDSTSGCARSATPGPSAA